MANFIISGKLHSGKTTFAKNLANELSNLGLGVGGFLAIGTFDGGERASFSILGLLSGDEMLLASKNEADITGEKFPFAKYFFSKQAFDFGKNEFQAALQYNSTFIIIDEVGKMELDGNGWAPLLREPLSSSSIIAVVRQELTEAVNKEFFQGSAKLITIDQSIGSAMEILESALG